MIFTPGKVYKFYPEWEHHKSWIDAFGELDFVLHIYGFKYKFCKMDGDLADFIPVDEEPKIIFDKDIHRGIMTLSQEDFVCMVPVECLLSKEIT